MSQIQLDQNLKLDAASQKELEQFMEGEQAQARVHQTVHNLTGMCWDKCVTGSVSTSFSRGERSCLENCVDRFLDTSLFLVKRVEDQRSMLGQ